MGAGNVLLLGFIAGATILLGLPIGRLRRPSPGLKQLLNATACGILLFLFWDVLGAAFGPFEESIEELAEVGPAGITEMLGFGVLFLGGLAAGLTGLVSYEGWVNRRGARQRQPPVPDASANSDLTRGPASWSTGHQLALLIAVGIGLHNFAEGLAIGSAAATGKIALATILVIGFGLHNATEGFGITAPMAGDEDRPSWPFLLALGAIGGGPTFVGTLIGRSVTSEPVSVAFLSLAGGSILYVVIQLIGLGLNGRRTLLAWGLILGLAAGFITDAIIDAAGA